MHGETLKYAETCCLYTLFIRYSHRTFSYSTHFHQQNTQIKINHKIYFTSIINLKYVLDVTIVCC